MLRLGVVRGVLVYFVTLFLTKSINIWHGFLNVTQKVVETLNISTTEWWDGRNRQILALREFVNVPQSSSSFINSHHKSENLIRKIGLGSIQFHPTEQRTRTNMKKKSLSTIINKQDLFEALSLEPLFTNFIMDLKNPPSNMTTMIYRIFNIWHKALNPNPNH